jgi:hypothetical protein
MQAVQGWFSQHSPSAARVSPLSILRQTHKLFYFLFDPFRKQRFDVSARLAKAIGMAIYFWIETCLAGRVFIFSGMEVEGCGGSRREAGERAAALAMGSSTLPPNPNPNHRRQGWGYGANATKHLLEWGRFRVFSSR